MEFSNLIEGRILKRDHRFMAAVRIQGTLAYAHIANSGRLPGLLNPGARIWLSKSDNKDRKTSYDLKLVEQKGVLVSIDARLPNKLLMEAITEKKITGFNYSKIQPEVRLGKSRIDFQLSLDKEKCWIETKSVTLVESGTAMFPDAPTERGRRHLIELKESVSKNTRAAVVFVIQRGDASEFRANRSVDPEFSQTLAEAKAHGVDVRAFKCEVSTDRIAIVNEIPVIFNTQVKYFTYNCLVENLEVKPIC